MWFLLRTPVMDEHSCPSCSLIIAVHLSCPKRVPKRVGTMSHDRGWHEHEELGPTKGTTPDLGPRPNPKEGVPPLGWNY